MTSFTLDNVEKVKRFLKDVFPNSGYPGVYLAGGAARSLKTNEPVVDYDLFFDSAETAERFEKELLYRAKTEVVYRCPAGELVTIKFDKYKIQLIKKTYHPDAADLMARFDFNICKFAVDCSDFSLRYEDADLSDAYNKVLRLNNLQYPVATLHRVKKYLDKGFAPPDWQWFWQDILKRAAQIEMTDENMALYID